VSGSSSDDYLTIATTSDPDTKTMWRVFGVANRSDIGMRGPCHNVFHLALFPFSANIVVVSGSSSVNYLPITTT
jgi:hypothetical protein